MQYSSTEIDEELKEYRTFLESTRPLTNDIAKLIRAVNRNSTGKRVGNLYLGPAYKKFNK